MLIAISLPLYNVRLLVPGEPACFLTPLLIGERMSSLKFVRSIRLICLPLAFCAATTSTLAQTGTKALTIKSLDDFQNCIGQYYNHDACLTALEKYVRSTPKEAMKASKLVRLNFNASVSLRFFEMAAKQNVPGFCQDEDLQLAVVHGLGMPKDYPDAARARTLFSGTCYEPLAAAVVKELKGESTPGYLSENACPILKQHNQTPAGCQPAPAAKAPPQADERLPKIDKSQIKLGILKVYSGPEGERVTMAPIQGGDLFLIRFDGVAGPWNGKVLLHKRADRGNDAADFWTEHNGARWDSVLRRSGMTVFVPGATSRNGFSIGYAEKPSQEADSAALLKAYQP